MQTNLALTYQQRRQRLVERANGVLLIGSPGMSPDTNLWDKNLAYLTGLTDRSAYLLIVPQGVAVEFADTRSTPELMRGHIVHEILFMQPRAEQDVFMEGLAPTFAEILAATGVDRVFPLDQMSATLQRALMTTDTLWLNTPPIPQLDQPLTAEMRLAQQIRERFYWITLKNVASIIHQMRFVKDEYEVASLREAFEVQCDIFQKIMQALKPGENESLGQAIFDYEIQIRPDYIGHGMGDELYEASIIVGSGVNSAIPHYLHNNQVIQDGDLVLIDAGVSVNGYRSDITRTFPANGKFTPRQREVYAIVLEAEEAAIATMKPGSTMLAAHQAAYAVFEKHGLAQYGYGNCGHPVGLNIHDANGRYPDDREQPFEPGVVVVIEPFLMMPHENMGIRIEDGVLITESGHEVLAGPPRAIEAVEMLCKRS
ncbi:MAG: M24 family metallopeptidase [Chloroflexi bacterium]|nr:M24 family metallopeptidase [Chloroflexota bacterium]